MTATESEAVKKNLEAILFTIRRLDGEFPALKAERDRRSVGDQKLLGCMDAFDDFKHGNFFISLILMFLFL